MRPAVLCVLALGCGSTHVAVVDDAGSDAGRDSAPAGGDAGAVDASSEAGGGDSGSGYCATQPGAAFCDDFDVGDLGARWDFVQQTPPGVATLDVSTFVSPPAALGIVTKKLIAAELGSILLRKTVKGTASRAHLGFAVNGDDAQGTGTLAIATLDLALDHLLTLYLRDDDPSAPGATLTELPPGGSASVRNPFAAAIPAGTWTRVDVDVDAVNGQAVVRIGGATALTTTIAAAKAVDTTIRVGILVSGPADSYTMRFDDVVLEVTP